MAYLSGRKVSVDILVIFARVSHWKCLADISKVFSISAERLWTLNGKLARLKVKKGPGTCADKMDCLSQHTSYFFGDQPCQGICLIMIPVVQAGPLPSSLFSDTKRMGVGTQHVGFLPGWPHARPQRWGAWSWQPGPGDLGWIFSGSTALGSHMYSWFHHLDMMGKSSRKNLRRSQPTTPLSLPEEFADWGQTRDS